MAQGASPKMHGSLGSSGSGGSKESKETLSSKMNTEEVTLQFEEEKNELIEDKEVNYSSFDLLEILG